MVPLDKETNLDVLRSYTKHLLSVVETLASENTLLKNAAEADKQAWLNQEIRDQYLKLREMHFGSGQEKLKTTNASREPGHANGAQLTLHAEHDIKVEPARKENLPEGPQYFYHLSERQLKAESFIRGVAGDHSAWEEIKGLYQQSKMVSVIEKKYVEEIHSQLKYRLKKAFNMSEKEVIVTAPGPVKLRPHSRYSLDFAVSVAIDKYEYHLPLERQRRQMEALGLNIDVKTLYSLCEAVGEHCNSIIPRIEAEIKNDFCCVHVDETKWNIIGDNTQSYMWAMSNRVGSIYRFEPTRSGKIAEEMLKNYYGAILTDGFSGYNRMKKPGKKLRAVAHCWSHARREFFDIRSAYVDETTKIIEVIDKLFEIERRARDFDELRLLRKTESRDYVQRLYDLIVETKFKTLTNSGLAKACNYVLNQWQGLTHFLTDLSVPLSNNDAERALRHVVMGRKNFNGSKTINGADVAASIYSVIESAKKAGLQPKVYLKYLIDERWHSVIPKTPQEYAREHLPKNKRANFPPRDQWKID
jgi:transposase